MDMNTASKLFFAFFTALTLLSSTNGIAQSPDWELDKMPPDLERDFALSALPPHLRDQATVYLLDPKKGYYTAKQGTNGFVTFVCRTEWEWGEYTRETFSAISFDAEGQKTLVPVLMDVAKMRATGKYSAKELQDIIVKGIKDGTYKAPGRAGVSYMLAPMMRTKPGGKEIVSIIMPHYMFYAPNVINADIGGAFDSYHPFILDGVPSLNDGHAIFNYIIVPVGEAETKRIVEENKDLLRRLEAFKGSLRVDVEAGHQH
jgi:hypothetical protein